MGASTSAADLRRRARFNEVSDALRQVIGDRQDPRRAQLLREFVLLQRSYLRGSVSNELMRTRLGSRLKQDSLDDCEAYVITRMIGSLERGNRMHWHMLFSTYCFAARDWLTAEGRRERELLGAVADEADPEDVLEARSPAWGTDAAGADPASGAGQAGLLEAFQQLQAHIATGPDGIRNPDRSLQILQYHLAGIDNNAEVARLMGVAEGTIRREWNELRAVIVRDAGWLREMLED